jgi:hypothetical protein
MASIAACDVGTRCAGCDTLQFTMSGVDGADAGAQTTSAQVVTGTRSPPAATFDDGSEDANGPAVPPRGIETSGTAGNSAGYTVVRREQATTSQGPTDAASSPAAVSGSISADSAILETDGASDDREAPYDSQVPPGSPAQSELVVAPFGLPAPSVEPKTNVAPTTPRSLNYPMPPVPGR